MQIKYIIIGVIVLAAAAIIFVLARMNQRDEKFFEKDLNGDEIKPDNHDKNESIL